MYTNPFRLSSTYLLSTSVLLSNKTIEFCTVASVEKWFYCILLYNNAQIDCINMLIPIYRQLTLQKPVKHTIRPEQ
jgi:hypothetical protein